MRPTRLRSWLRNGTTITIEEKTPEAMRSTMSTDFSEPLSGITPTRPTRSLLAQQIGVMFRQHPGEPAPWMGGWKELKDPRCVGAAVRKLAKRRTWGRCLKKILDVSVDILN